LTEEQRLTRDSSSFLSGQVTIKSQPSAPLKSKARGKQRKFKVTKPEVVV